MAAVVVLRALFVAVLFTVSLPLSNEEKGE